MATGRWANRVERGRQLWECSRTAAALAPSRRTAVQNLLGTLTFPIRRRISSRPLDLRIAGFRRFRVADRSEISVTCDVLARGAYGVVPIPSSGVVVDLGANVGAATLFFRSRSDRARIIAVEPNPPTFERLRGNVQGVPNVELVQAAITGHDGRATLHQTGASWSASLSWRGGDDVDVRAMTLQTLLDDCDVAEVDLLKIDVEGSEFAIAETFTRWDRVNRIVCEVHGQHEPIEAALSPTHDIEWVDSCGEVLLVATRR